MHILNVFTRSDKSQMSTLAPEKNHILKLDDCGNKPPGANYRCLSLSWGVKDVLLQRRAHDVSKLHGDHSLPYGERFSTFLHFFSYHVS